MNRRRFFEAALVLGAFSPAVQADERGATVTIEAFSADGKSLGKSEVPRIVKTDAEWRAQLSPEAYRVTRQEGTERAYTGEYDKHRAAGIYNCICCDTALFSSRTKFDSRTGWPSFYRPISKANIVESDDYHLIVRRTAVSCARCDAHLGHVFEDGPEPTGLRYCMNSVALKFVPRPTA